MTHIESHKIEDLLLLKALTPTPAITSERTRQNSGRNQDMVEVSKSKGMEEI